MTISSFQSPTRSAIQRRRFRAVRDCPTFTYPDAPNATTRSQVRHAGPGGRVHRHALPDNVDSSLEPSVDVGIEITRVGMFDLLATTEYVQDGKLDTDLLASLTRAAVGRIL